MSETWQCTASPSVRFGMNSGECCCLAVKHRTASDITIPCYLQLATQTNIFEGKTHVQLETAIAWFRIVFLRKCLTCLFAGSPIFHKWQYWVSFKWYTNQNFRWVSFFFRLILLCSSQKHAENLGRQEMLFLITVACKIFP